MPNKASAKNRSDSEPTPKCGIIMPISAIDGLSEQHWLEVNTILSDAIKEAGFDPNLVSSAEEVGIIQETIIHNLYDNPVMVCDVSGKNPNVMFELGMRLAFDKPTVIVKDDQTTYSFDTSPIEHLNYPRDLRFSRIVDFKAKLSDKVKNTYNKAMNNPSYTTFLKHFGEFKVAKIDKTEVSGQEFIIEQLKELKDQLNRVERHTRIPTASASPSASTSPSTSKIYQIELRDEASRTKARNCLDTISKLSLEVTGEIKNGRLRLWVPDNRAGEVATSFLSGYWDDGPFTSTNGD